MKKLTFVFLISLLGISAVISGCGQTGSLYIPVSEEAATEAAEDAAVDENAQENEDTTEAEPAASTD
jgi:predicted small lipoprotein YifL